MSYEFAIPLAQKELLNRTGVNQYVVDEVLSLRHLPDGVRGKSISTFKFRDRN